MACLNSSADIQNINTYLASRLPTSQLSDDWRILCAWWSSKLKGSGPSYSKKQILNLAVCAVRPCIEAGMDPIRGSLRAAQGDTQEDSQGTEILETWGSGQAEGIEGRAAEGNEEKGE